MKGNRFSAEQIVNKLRQAEVLLAQGQTITQVSKTLGVTEQTYYRWRERVRRHQVRPGPSSQGSGAGEWPAEAAAGGGGTGQGDSAGGGQPKLLSPQRRREAVDRVVECLDVSQRRACRVLRQSRRTQRYLPRVRDDEAPLTARIIELAALYGRYGVPRITAVLRAEGWDVNHQRVERIGRREGLKVPAKQPKRGRLWLNDGSVRWARRSE